MHLDADIYEATLDGLKFFYPRMPKGGIILIHDYNALHLVGIKKAIDEFFKDKPERIIDLGDNALDYFYPARQALMIKE